tara:strand:+ start:3094 stop:5025 length:1932 start_codon:yes stop_codon:yes gene_type:complete
MAEKEGLFSRLTKLFRSGPTVRRKVKNFKPSNAADRADVFGYGANSVYNNALSAYGTFDRMSRYSDFAEMESTPEIASALDIYSEETVSVDEKGRSLHIYSDNRKIQGLLENLFYDVLNVEFNLVMWTRNLCKYGDFFLFIEVDPEYGVTHAYPIPIAEIEREEGYDSENPAAVRFRWISNGNQVLENWQIIHFRLLGNDAFLPYGSSVLDSARRIWRQLILIEDAMLVYRIIRAPERRVFYIDVGNVAPDDIPNYMKQAQDNLKRNKVVDKDTGRVDLRYNPLSVDEDYFLPVRGSESGTKIDSLAGGTNTAAIEDVEYIQKKLFAALKIPRAYLGYDEDIGSKATLAQEDIRFSRAIQRIQKTIISELNKLAIIHLYSHGFTDEDLIDFDLKLSNPSSIAQQQKLELISTRFDIAGKVPEGVVDRRWIRKNVMGLTNAEIEKIEEGREEDKLRDIELEAIKPEGDDAPEDAGGGLADMGDEEGEGLFAGDRPLGALLTSVPKDEDEDEEEEEEEILFSIADEDAPMKAQSQILNVFNEPIKKRRKTTGPASVGMPDFAKMTAVGKNARTQDSMSRPYDRDSLKSFVRLGEDSGPFADFLEKKTYQHAIMTKELEAMISSMDNSLDISASSLLSESENNEDE